MADSYSISTSEPKVNIPQAGQGPEEQVLTRQNPRLPPSCPPSSTPVILKPPGARRTHPESLLKHMLLGPLLWSFVSDDLGWGPRMAFLTQVSTWEAFSRLWHWCYHTEPGWIKCPLDYSAQSYHLPLKSRERKEVTPKANYFPFFYRVAKSFIPGVVLFALATRAQSLLLVFCVSCSSAWKCLLLFSLQLFSMFSSISHCLQFQKLSQILLIHRI